MIKTKSVYSPIDPTSDGLRILVSRLRGRGLPKSRYDVWMANLGPSEKLLNDYRAGKITWAKFMRTYRAEISSSAALDKNNRLIKNHGQKFTLRLLKALGERGHVTLLCLCDEDQKHCHRHVLAKLLSGKIG